MLLNKVYYGDLQDAHRFCPGKDITSCLKQINELIKSGYRIFFFEPFAKKFEVPRSGTLIKASMNYIIKIFIVINLLVYMILDTIIYKYKCIDKVLPFYKFLLKVLSTFLFIASCSPKQESDLMRDELANIYKKASMNPKSYYHMNKFRVDWMKKKAEDLPAAKIMTHRYYLSQELLRAGLSEEAISELNGIISDIGVRTDWMNNSTRSLIDELALAYLRLGEQVNCIENHTGDSCIMPIAEEGIQVKTESTKKAIDLYKKILKSYPNDLGSRWLLNIAYMSIGLYPDGVPKQYLVKGLEGNSSNKISKFSNIAHEVGLATNGISGGLNVEDFNNDGHLDLFMTSYGLSDPPHLFFADGKGGYYDHTLKLD